MNDFDEGYLTVDKFLLIIYLQIFKIAFKHYLLLSDINFMFGTKS